MKLQFVVLHLGRSRLEVFLDDAHGRRRKVVVKWQKKDAVDEPPKHWSDSVKGEMEFQDGEALRKMPHPR